MRMKTKTVVPAVGVGAVLGLVRPVESWAVVTVVVVVALLVTIALTIATVAIFSAREEPPERLVRILAVLLGRRGRPRS